jgi:methionyl-tRNA synthetase
LTTDEAGHPVIIIAPPPTPNGDLHIGHIAGPYLAGDVYARYLRALGRQVVFTTGTDDSQTYVLASARRAGRTPEELAASSWLDIRRSLDLMGISVDGFAPFDDGYRATVRKFVDSLHTAGKFRERIVPIPYAERTGEFLMEGLVAGECPHCLSESRGGLCETCGLPIDFGELIDPRSTVDPAEPLTSRDTTVLVLPMEDYREQLTAYYTARQPYWRPHMRQLIEQALAHPLPDFPVTYPSSWGIPAEFPQVPGQVLNAWVEGMPASMYCTYHGAGREGEHDELWRAEGAAELVYFLGFDNAYFWGMNHLALLMAHEGRYIVPEMIVCNEFYELENEKFSTSKGHVLWTGDLLADVPRDLVRFYLALTCPEHQRTNFSLTGLRQVTSQRLAEPWNQLATALAKAAADAGGDQIVLPVSDAARAHAAALAVRFQACYELNSFSLHRAADLIATQVARLADHAARLSENRQSEGPGPLGDLFFETRVLLAGAAPVLIDLAAAVGTAGREITLSRLDATEISPFPLPVFEQTATGHRFGAQS